MTSRLRLMVLCLAFAAVPALAADAGERRFITDGMSEGQVLMKIGRPDSESEDTGGGAKVKEKTWIYFPAPGDAQTMTTLVIREGKVIRVDRRISR